jgi:hypothetical protein
MSQFSWPCPSSQGHKHQVQRTLNPEMRRQGAGGAGAAAAGAHAAGDGAPPRDAAPPHPQRGHAAAAAADALPGAVPTPLQALRGDSITIHAASRAVHTQPERLALPVVCEYLPVVSAGREGSPCAGHIQLCDDPNRHPDAAACCGSGSGRGPPGQALVVISSSARIDLTSRTTATLLAPKAKERLICDAQLRHLVTSRFRILATVALHCATGCLAGGHRGSSGVH